MSNLFSVKGWHWGNFKTNENNIQIMTNEKPSVQISYSDISNATLTNDREMTLEFHVDDTDQGANNGDDICEMRFYFPDSNEEKNEIEPKDLLSTIIKNANLSSSSAELIVNFPEVKMLLPRGTCSIDIFGTFLKTHGKTHSYKILYKNIKRVYKLKKNDGVTEFIVLNLETPIKQGQTYYPFLILQFNSNISDTLSLSLTEEQKLAYKDILSESMAGKVIDTFCTIFSTITQKQITISGGFKSDKGSECIKCLVKVQEGFLYPLSKSFMFIPKPVIFVRFDDIRHVEFGRYQASIGEPNKSFDLSVVQKDGNKLEFNAIDKKEYLKLKEFLISSNIKILNLEKEIQKASNSNQINIEETKGKEDEDDENDEDFKAGEDEEESDSFEESLEPEEDIIPTKKSKKSKQSAKATKDNMVDDGDEEVKE